MKAGLITVVSALALVIPAWVAINGPGNGSGVMSPVHPFPALTVVASFISAAIRPVATRV